MKIIEVGYNVKEHPLKLDNGDQYDSVIKVYEGWDFDKGTKNIKKIHEVPFVNADSGVRYNNIRVVDTPVDVETLFWIKSFHKPHKKYRQKNGKMGWGYPAIVYINLSYLKTDAEKEARLSKIKSRNDLTLEERTFTANKRNPNHKANILKYINLHKGGINSDWSAGCHTVLADGNFYPYWHEFEELFKQGEKGKLIIYS